MDIAYSRLQELLAAQEWKEANQETRVILLKALGREKEDTFAPADFKRFLCSVLYTIDLLWKQYSNGHFGFSVQKRIWKTFGTERDCYQCLGNFLGWRVQGRWRHCESLNFDLNAPEGHLPVIKELSGYPPLKEWPEMDVMDDYGEYLLCKWLSFFFFRIEICNL